jgi:hypothetical protein
VLYLRLLELINKLISDARDSYFIVYFWVQLMISKTILLIYEIDKFQHKFDKYYNYVKDIITKNI